LGAGAWKLSLGNLRLGAFAWGIYLGNFRLGTFASNRLLAIFRLRSALWILLPRDCRVGHFPVDLSLWNSIEDLLSKSTHVCKHGCFSFHPQDALYHESTTGPCSAAELVSRPFSPAIIAQVYSHRQAVQRYIEDMAEPIH